MEVSCDEDEGKYLYIPEGFSIGTASASYQIEGGWNADGKGENVWDWFTHNQPWRITDRSSGDIACDSYHRFTEDIKLAKELGGQHYRFSLSWSRILPNGFSNNISKAGLEYYHAVIDEALANGIQPFVTIYHWDHPQILEDMGGWTNELMVDWFSDYARVVFQEFGNKVKFFATLNEPYVVCTESYGTGTKAPGKTLTDIGLYLCMHNILKAHAKAYHIYDDEFRAKQDGIVGIVLPCQGFFPKTPEDEGTEDIMFEFNCGWTAHPIYSETGDYPEVMKNRIAENSRLAGYPRSRLPTFSEEEIKYIKGTADYFGLNHYTSRLTEIVPRKDGEMWSDDHGVRISMDPDWPGSASAWLKVVPKGFGWTIRKIKTEYGNPLIYVTENGFSDRDGLTDINRINYLLEYMSSMLIAMNRDDCNVKAYTVWSILDNFEWERGYTERFGIVHVDFTSPNRTRTKKSSFQWLKETISTRKIQPVPTSPTTMPVS